MMKLAKNKYLIIFLFTLNFFLSFSLIAYDPEMLKREYEYLDSSVYRYSSEYCFDCLSDFVSIDDGESVHGFYYIVPYPRKWCSCSFCGGNRPIYFGYVDPRFRRYKPHFERQSQLLRNYPKCKCFWPESSELAGEISDRAYDFFFSLLNETQLKKLFEFHEYRSPKNCHQKYFVDTVYGLSRQELIVSFIAQQFFFSDYYAVCRDIKDYSKFKLPFEEYLKISYKVDEFLIDIYPKFLNVYQNCLTKHSIPEIEEQILFMKYFRGEAF